MRNIFKCNNCKSSYFPVSVLFPYKNINHENLSVIIESFSNSFKYNDSVQEKLMCFWKCQLTPES